MKGRGIHAIVRERTYLNLGLILVLNIVLLFGVWLVFRNVKKEIQLAENKSVFVSNVSHEIRTPLSLISMFAETLEMGRVQTKEKQQEYYEIISKEAQRLTAIVNRILNFSQVEANKSSYTLEPLDLGGAVDEVLKTYTYHLESKGFDYSFTKEDNLIIEADKEALQEVIINVLDNAIKYSNKTRNINIQIANLGNMAYLSIQDHGIGISARDQKNIFDKFYRVSTGDLAKGQGTGLGLSLVKHIISRHNGKIKVKSELGRGTTFTIYLPLKQ
nr:HAMP domain-containing sensor histidine kinase [Fulvivirga marina]